MRVLIVADNAVTASGIKLEMRYVSGCEVVGILNGRGTCSLAASQQKPDVVLLDDIRDSKLTLTRIAELRRAVPGAKLVLLTLRMEPTWLAEASAAGIDAAVAKVAHTGGIGTLVREVIRGNVFHAFAAEPPLSRPNLHELTARELEILRLAASGNSNRRIAEQLWVTEQTVKFHLSNVYRKLGVSNRTEASHVAHRDRLVEPAGSDVKPMPLRALDAVTDQPPKTRPAVDERAA